MKDKKIMVTLITPTKIVKQYNYYRMQKRTMYSITINAFTRTLLVLTTNKNNSLIYKKTACYEVDKHNVANTSHKQSQEMIIQKKDGQTFQHPSFVRFSCKEKYCIHT